MKKMILTAILLFASASFASKNAALDKAVAKLKNSDTRTVVTEIENKDGNPCLPAGKSYQVELQVKQASLNGETMQVTYSWETAKTINVSKSGEVMEVCGE